MDWSKNWFSVRKVWTSFSRKTCEISVEDLNLKNMGWRSMIACLLICWEFLISKWQMSVCPWGLLLRTHRRAMVMFLALSWDWLHFPRHWQTLVQPRSYSWDIFVPVHRILKVQSIWFTLFHWEQPSLPKNIFAPISFVMEDTGACSGRL